MMRRLIDLASWLGIIVMCLAAITMTAGLALGFRPIAITTGSMDPWAPTGALVIAGPTDADDLQVGDVLVMNKTDDVIVTHRVIGLERQRGQLMAITQGDANEDPDPEPYQVGANELTGRLAVSGGGRLLVAINYRVVLLLVVTGALVTLAQTGLRLIWSDDEDDDDDDDDPGIEDQIDPGNGTEAVDGETAAGSTPTAGRRRKASLLPIASALATLLMADASYALFTASETVGNNTFTTLNCAAADGITMQRGTAVSLTGGVTTATITAVDPARAFLLFTIRSNRNNPADSMVRGELTNSTTVSFYRNTNANNRPVTIEWSVVEYACGVTVQRGTTAGNNGTTLDVPIATVDASASFAIATTVPGANYTTFDTNEMVRAEVLNDTTVRLSSYFLEGAMTYGWQAISFDEPGVASVQKVSTTLGPGTTTATLTLPTAVDPTKTFLVGGVISGANGSAIGQQAVRATLLSATQVQVVRGLNSSSTDVQVQIVTLNDGTTVQSGVANFARNENVQTVTIASVDTTIATALSTVNLPGSMSGGSSLVANQDRVSDASATFVVNDATTITIARDSARRAASFGWQVIEWAK